MYDVVTKADIFAEAAHAAVGQLRKYTGDHYIVHPRAVAQLVASTAFHTPNMLAAALLHDVLEDTQVTAALIEGRFGANVAFMVQALTDEYTPEKYPDFNRATRKKLEALRIADAHGITKTIKLADMIDNTKSIGEHDPKFLQVYGPEKRNMLEALRGGDPMLWEQADTILKGYGF